NQLLGKTLSGCSADSSSNRCTVTPSSLSRSAATVTSSWANTASSLRSRSPADDWKVLSASVAGLGKKWCGLTSTTARGACVDMCTTFGQGSGGNRRVAVFEQAEQVLRIVGVGNEVDVGEEGGALHTVAQEPQHGEVFDGEAHGVEHRDLLFARAPHLGSGDDLPQFRDGEVGRELLNLALDAGLLRELDEDIRSLQNLDVELGLAGAVAA